MKKIDGKKLFNLVKKELAKRMAENKAKNLVGYNQAVYVDVCSKCEYDLNYKIIGNYYEVSVDGNTYKVNTKYEVHTIFSEFKKLCEELKKTKGWGGLYFKENGVENTISMVGLAPVPCKEYKSLANYLNKYGRANLGNYALFCSAMGGKRGCLWDDYGERYYLDNKPKKCKEILDTLRKVRTAKDTMTCIYGKENYIDDMERRISAYQEVECEGEKRHYLVIEVKTPSGRVKYNQKIY